jgi:hypothetical protein
LDRGVVLAHGVADRVRRRRGGGLHGPMHRPNSRAMQWVEVR